MIQHVASEFPPGLNPTGCNNDGGCADELAYYLANYDQSDLPGTQTIRTYVVGGFLEDNSGGDDDSDAGDGGSNNDLNGIPLLKSIAHHGDGEYFGANSYEEIVAALGEIFGSVSETPATSAIVENKSELVIKLLSVPVLSTPFPEINIGVFIPP